MQVGRDLQRLSKSNLPKARTLTADFGEPHSVQVWSLRMEVWQSFWDTLSEFRFILHIVSVASWPFISLSILRRVQLYLLDTFQSGRCRSEYYFPYATFPLTWTKSVLRLIPHITCPSIPHFSTILLHSCTSVSFLYWRFKNYTCRCDHIGFDEKWMIIFPDWLSVAQVTVTCKVSSYHILRCCPLRPQSFCSKAAPQPTGPSQGGLRHQLISLDYWAPLNNSSPFKHISHSRQCDTILKFPESIVFPSVINKGDGQHWYWYCCPRNWLPAGFCSTDDNALGPVVQLIFYSNLYPPGSEHMDTMRDYDKGLGKAKVSTIHCFTLLYTGSHLIVKTIGLVKYDLTE